jgi:hypothetical protein
VTAILGNVHDDVVTSTVTIPSAGTGSPTPDLAAPSTGGSLQMVTARLRPPHEYPPIWSTGCPGLIEAGAFPDLGFLCACEACRAGQMIWLGGVSTARELEF